MRIVEGIKRKRGAPVAVDNLGQRHALDTLGLVGFGKDFGSTCDLDAPNAEADAFHIIDAGPCPSPSFPLQDAWSVEGFRVKGISITLKSKP
jgi:hypothetical protein